VPNGLRAAAPASDEEVVAIDRLASGGDGVGRLGDGRTVFVPFSAPGDRLRIRVTERRARYARGELIEILAPGRARRAPRCGLYGRCGGCSWQHLDYTTQLEAKRTILLDAIERIGGLAAPPGVEIVGSPEEYGYRTRARVVAAGGAVGFRRPRSHEIEATLHCPVLAPALETRLGDAARLGALSGAPVEIELAVGHDGTVRVAAVDDAGASEAVDLVVAGERLRISPGVFAQANGALLGPLCDAVAAAAGSGRSAAELYAGAGLFTLGLSRRFERVLAIEANPLATADLSFNLERAGRRDRVSIRTAPVERAVRALREARPELVVLDPPRTGLAPAARAALAALGAERIVYVSCDPATLARDLSVLCAQGHELRSLRAFDLFPQTHHVEAVALLASRG
jgi:23S rRNA (uracil1939-C5)-methyltransferase